MVKKTNSAKGTTTGRFSKVTPDHEEIGPMFRFMVNQLVKCNDGQETVEFKLLTHFIVDDSQMRTLLDVMRLDEQFSALVLQWFTHTPEGVAIAPSSGSTLLLLDRGCITYLGNARAPLDVRTIRVVPQPAVLELLPPRLEKGVTKLGANSVKTMCAGLEIVSYRN